MMRLRIPGVRWQLVVAIPLATGGLARAVAAQTDCPGRIPEPVYKRLIAREFASIANPKSPVNVANFGSYEAKDGQITFSGSSAFESGRVFTLKASGSGSDGAFPFLKGSDLQSKVALDVQVHTLTRNTTLAYDYASCVESARAAQKAQDEYKRRMIVLDSGVARTNARLRLERLRRDTAARALVIQARTAAVGSASVEERARLDSIRAAQALAVDSIRLTALDTLPPTAADSLAPGNQRAMDLTAADAKLAVTGYHLKWLSFGLGIENNAFKRFDSTAALEAQIMKATSTGVSFRANYSMLSRSRDARESWYLSVGLKAALTDNFDKLRKTELTETRQFGPAEHDRERITKTTAYTGDHEEDIGTLGLSLDWYQFVFGDMAAAVHMYPSVVATQDHKPITSVGVGFLALYKNGEGKPVVNAELYYEVEDVWRVAHDNSLRDRRTLGFRFTVPLTFAARE